MKVNAILFTLLAFMSLVGACIGAWAHDLAVMIMDGCASPLFAIGAVAAWLTVIFQVGR